MVTTGIFTAEAERKALLLPHQHTLFEGCPGGCKDIVTVNEAISRAKAELDAIESQVQGFHDQVLRLETRLDESNARSGRIEIVINDNAGAMIRNTADTAEILKMMRDREATFRIFKGLGNFVKWAASILLPLTALFLLIKNGGK